MKWVLAMLAISGCTAAFVSRVLRLLAHRKKGGPMMRRRMFGSAGVALASLGWAAAVLLLIGLVRRGPKVDWSLLIIATIASLFMAWTLWRADQADRSGGGISQRQQEAAEALRRVREGLPPEE